MQTTFQQVYQDIHHGKLTQMAGLWLVHGDDPLVLQWFIDACRPLFQAKNQLIKRISLDSPKRWGDVLAEIDSLSLFGDDSALLLSNKQKCDGDTIKALTHFADESSAGNSGHCVIYQLPRQDKKEQASALFKLFAGQGVVVDAHIYDEKGRAKVLALKADEMGLRLDRDAWRFLLEHTENNLLSAHQALWRASDLYPHHAESDTALDVPALMPALVSDDHYSVFNLCDTLLTGDAVKSLHILHTLRQMDTAPAAILWALAKEVRLLLGLQSGKHTGELGIWQSKAHLYHSALRRQMADDYRLDDGVLLNVYAIDKAIKGVNTDIGTGSGDVWHLLERLCLQVTGVRLAQA